MIRPHFVIKRKTSTNKDEVIGRLVSVGIHIINQPKIKKGLVRLVKINKTNFTRLHNKQIVITPEGLGVVRDYHPIKDEDEYIMPKTINVRVRNLNRHKLEYLPSQIKVVDIIDDKTGKRYPAIDRDYPLLLLDDALVTFIVDNLGYAHLSLESRGQYANLKIFAKKSNGLRILNELIQKGIWNPTKSK
jgi:hypothetical protein